MDYVAKLEAKLEKLSYEEKLAYLEEAKFNNDMQDTWDIECYQANDVYVYLINKYKEER